MVEEAMVRSKVWAVTLSLSETLKRGRIPKHSSPWGIEDHQGCFPGRWVEEQEVEEEEVIAIGGNSEVVGLTVIGRWGRMDLLKLRTSQVEAGAGNWTS